MILKVTVVQAETEEENATRRLIKTKGRANLSREG